MPSAARAMKPFPKPTTRPVRTGRPSRRTTPGCCPVLRARRPQASSAQCCAGCPVGHAVSPVGAVPQGPRAAFAPATARRHVVRVDSGRSDRLLVEAALDRADMWQRLIGNDRRAKCRNRHGRAPTPSMRPAAASKLGPPLQRGWPLAGRQQHLQLRRGRPPGHADAWFDALLTTAREDHPGDTSLNELGATRIAGDRRRRLDGTRRLPHRDREAGWKAGFRPRVRHRAHHWASRVDRSSSGPPVIALRTFG